MDYKRLALAAVVTWFVDGVYGIAVWTTMLGNEFVAMYRPAAQARAAGVAG